MRPTLSYLPVSNTDEAVLKFKRSLRPFKSARDIKLTILSLFYLVACLFIVCLANSIADRINPNNQLPIEQRKPLPDVLLTFLNYYYKLWALPIELSDRFIVASAIVACIKIFTMGNRTFTITRRFLFVAGTVYLVRSVSVVLTVLPNPLTECISEPNENLFYDALQLFLAKRTSCGDVFFSVCCFDLGNNHRVIRSSLRFRELFGLRIVEIGYIGQSFH